MKSQPQHFRSEFSSDVLSLKSINKLAHLFLGHLPRWFWLQLITVCTWSCSVQFSSVSQSCPTLCDPHESQQPGLPVHHQLLEFTQTHVHRVSDAIQPSHPLSSTSPPDDFPRDPLSVLSTNTPVQPYRIAAFETQHLSNFGTFTSSRLIP